MAVAAAPDDVALRAHLAELLAAAGLWPDAVREAAGVLALDPGHAGAAALIGRAPRPSEPDAPPAADAPDGDPLRALESEFEGIVMPMFADDDEAAPVDAHDVEQPRLHLDDVGGLAEVKARLEAAFLAPLRNPELGRLYKKSLGGGLLLYGPPGCGKTFIARALAGEIGARFISVSLADVLDMWVGASERNVHDIFELARRTAPCIVFLDELDALGQKRTQMHGSAGRGAVTQLLTEMDGVNSHNDGVYVLGATNHPWDVDVALRRPGRFDRMVLVRPPDAEARAAILRSHLHDRPIENINTGKLAKQSDGYSGADLAYVCEAAAERALLDSARSGDVRMIGQRDMEAALKEIKPSIGAWLQIARNVTQFANSDGSYDDLREYLRERRLI
jgi:SpoVK/Ycf46/Vps4 family AAA+-type ATPase